MTGDRKYGTEENIAAIEREHICPAGKELHFVQGQSTDRQRRYRAYVEDCNACPLKAQCTTNKQGRSLCRSVDEEYLDRVRGYQLTEPYKKALRKRSVWVEPLFARSARIGMACDGSACVNWNGSIVKR